VTALAGYVTLMTFDKQSNGRRTLVELKSSRIAVTTALVVCNDRPWAVMVYAVLNTSAEVLVRQPACN